MQARASQLLFIQPTTTKSLRLVVAVVMRHCMESVQASVVLVVVQRTTAQAAQQFRRKVQQVAVVAHRAHTMVVEAEVAVVLLLAQMVLAMSVVLVAQVWTSQHGWVSQRQRPSKAAVVVEVALAATVRLEAATAQRTRVVVV
jgi:hypothetical protein